MNNDKAAYKEISKCLFSDLACNFCGLQLITCEIYKRGLAAILEETSIVTHRDVAKGSAVRGGGGRVVHKYYLQHERQFCISIYKLEPKASVLYLIQHGRKCCETLQFY